MKIIQISFVVAVVLLSVPSGVLTAEPDEESTQALTDAVRELQKLFERYNRQEIGLNDVYERLNEWEPSRLKSAAGRIISSDADTLKKGLASEHLRTKVRPALRERLRKKRERLLRIIRDKQRYTPRNRSLKRTVTQAATGLLTLFRKPLVYHMQTTDKYSNSFFRTVALIRYLRSAGVSLTEDTRDLLKRIGKAKGIISSEKIGRSVELQPHYRENKDVVTSNKTPGVTLSDKERSLVETVNLYREAFGLRKLLIHKEVTQAARKQSMVMKESGQLTHLSNQSSKRPLLKRLRKAGFRPRKAGENVAKGNYSPMAILKGWIQSPAHHRNLLKEDYRYLGVAKEGRFWTLDMATVPRIQSQGSTSK
jgi:uncharacterized protein YkwD